MFKRRCLLLLALLTVALNAQAQEHSYAPSDIESGRGLYQANCLGCHGNNGDAVSGANLGKGKFRRAGNDEELIALIRGGIPNTLMVPRPQLGSGDLRALVAFLRNMQTAGTQGTDARKVALGDAKRGEQLFFGQGGCNKCHGINGGGSPLVPDLAGIGSQRTPLVLETALLDPKSAVREGNRFMQVVTRTGKTVTGKLMNQDTHSIQLLTEQEKLQSFAKASLSSYAIVPTTMPAAKDVLSPAQVADLVAYLLSLKSTEGAAR